MMFFVFSYFRDFVMRKKYMAEPTERKTKSIPVLDIENLAIAYKVRGGEVVAVQNVTLDIQKGESHGIVGESGCGKTTFALSILRLLPWNGKIVDGKILFHGTDIVGMDENEFNKEYRWKRLSYVFQGAMNALNPVFRTGDQIAKAIILHEDVGKKEALERAKELFSLVGIDPERVANYPHRGRWWAHLR